MKTFSIDDAVADADAPVLLVTVAHYTGDLSILRDEFRPDTNNLFDPNVGLSPEVIDEMRSLAAETLKKHQADGYGPAPVPSDEDLVKLITYLVGEEAAREHLELLREELGPCLFDRPAQSPFRCVGAANADDIPATHNFRS